MINNFIHFENKTKEEIKDEIESLYNFEIKNEEAINTINFFKNEFNPEIVYRISYWICNHPFDEYDESGFKIIGKIKGFCYDSAPGVEVVSLILDKDYNIKFELGADIEERFEEVALRLTDHDYFIRIPIDKFADLCFEKVSDSNKVKSIIDRIHKDFIELYNI